MIWNEEYGMWLNPKTMDKEIEKYEKENVGGRLKCQ